MKSYENALNTNNIESILGRYGQAPEFTPQHAPVLVGREALRPGYRQVFETIKLNVEFTTRAVEDFGYAAWARTRSPGRTRILTAGFEVAAGNNEPFIFKREQGDWRIHRYLFSTTEPSA